MLKIIKYLRLYLFFSICLCAGNSGENLLKNSSFESIIENKTIPENWILSKAFIGQREQGGVDGKYCICLDSPDGVGGILQKKIILSPQKRYELSYSVKAEKTGQKYKVYMEYSENGSRLSGSKGITAKATTDWDKKSFTFTLNKKIKRANLVLLQNDKGKIWFDDIVLRQIKSLPQNDNLLVNSNFEENFDLKNGWVPKVYKGTPQIKITSEGKAGSRALSIELGSSKDNGRCLQKVNVKPMQKYHLDINYKTFSTAKGIIYLMVNGKKSRYVRLKPCSIWKNVKFNFSTLKNEKQVKILILYAGTQGRLLVDNVKMYIGESKKHKSSKKNDTIDNFSFEQDKNKDNLPDSWEPSGAGIIKLDNNTFCSGKASLLLQADKNQTVSCRQDGIFCSPGTKYQLSLKVIGDKFNQPYRFYVGWNRLKTDKADYGAIIRREGSKWRDGFTSWQTKNLEFVTPQKRFKDMYIVLETRGPGKIWFDELKLKRINSQEKKNELAVIINEPYYRNTIFSSEPSKFISGIVKINSKIRDNDRVKIILKEANSEKNIHSASYKVVKKQTAFNIPVSNLPVGNYDLKVEYCVPDKKKMTQVVKIQKVKAVKHEVRVDKENTILFDNKKFFPIGVYSTEFTEFSFAKYHKLGFNTILYRSSNVASIRLVLNKASKYNLKVITSYIRGKNAHETTQHSGFLGYHNTDEPAWCGADMQILRNDYDEMRVYDPYHPVWMNHAPRNTIKTLKKYNEACDISGVDIYPVPAGKSVGGHSEMDDKTISCIGKYTQKMRRTVDDRKPVIMILQGFSWGKYYNPKAKDCRFPTYVEMRYMAWDAIINGAKGIFYYGTNYLNDKNKLWDIMGKVNNEILALNDLILAGNGEQIKSTNPRIAYLSKKLNGKNYLLAINTTPVKQKFVFFSKAMKGKCYSLLKPYTLNKNENFGFEDFIEPYDLKIYSDYNYLPVSSLKKSKSSTVSQKRYKEIPFENMGNGVIGYNWKAKWIWNSNKPFSSKAYFRKNFFLDNSPSKSYISIAADASYKLFVNGTYLGEGSCWTAKTYNLTKYMKKGSNAIAIECVGDGGPTGCIFEGKISLPDNKNRYFVSDENCKTTAKVKKDWKTAELKDSDWERSKIAYEVKNGPWGKIPILPPNN